HSAAIDEALRRSKVNDNAHLVSSSRSGGGSSPPIKRSADSGAAQKGAFGQPPKLVGAGWLGIGMIRVDRPRNASAVVVQVVHPRSPAADVLEPGTIILAVDGKPTEDPSDLLAMLDHVRPEGKIALTIELPANKRASSAGSSTRDVEVQLAPEPVSITLSLDCSRHGKTTARSDKFFLIEPLQDQNPVLIEAEWLSRTSSCEIKKADQQTLTRLFEEARENRQSYVETVRSAILTGRFKPSE
ncbi:MAG: DUF2610 domain-containing protein, partial [Hyphomicrobiaceae bacterium]|nr:DUF2610 domain-containing protein [Hyphomicrobiaceae bacterium]